MSETVSAQQNSGVILSTDGIPLKQKLARTTRKLKMRALLLTLPLVLFLLVSFVLPIGQMLFRSIHNPAGSNVLPVFAELIQDWDEQGLPDEPVFEAFVKDMQNAGKSVKLVRPSVIWPPGSTTKFPAAAACSPRLAAN